jgi:hypothetical protein
MTPFGCFKAHQDGDSGASFRTPPIEKLFNTRRVLNTLCVLTALALIGCGDGGGDGGNTNGNGTYAKELWGEWLRMDTGDKWYISNNALKVNGADAPTSAVLTKQSDRVIEVTDGGRKYYLYASRTATASFTGVIVGDAAGSARAIGGGLGGVRVAIENLVNKANELTTNTDTDGKFTADGVILGDAYKLTPEGGTSVTVIPTSNGDDIGVIAITSGVNFKTSLTPAQSSADMTELYINEVYQFDLEFENTGDEDCPAPVYAITAPSGVTITGNRQDILGTIEPGVKKSVPIGVRCYTVAGDYEYKKINVTIRDGTGKTWEDSVSLRFYKETLDFNIKAERPVSGIVIAPDAKTYSFTDVTDGVVSAPRRTAGDYLVVFSGATIETETRYSLGVGLEADGYFGGFFETSQYEPNNTEGSAVALGTQKIMAYLYKNDIDYYRVSYGEFNLLPTPTNVSASAADAKVTVSWTAVAGATSYNIYRSFGSNGTYSKVGASTTDSYVDTVGATGTYYYEVSAVNAGGFESVYSAPTEVAVTAPAVPTGVSASVADMEVTVWWNAVDGASAYNIYRSFGSTGTSTKVGASASPSYTETVTSVGTYYYEVSAVSSGGLESARSDPTAVAVTMEIDVTNLSETLSWLSANAASSTHYTLLLRKNESLPPQRLTYSGMDITIALKGKGGERTVSLEGNGSLFTVESGVTLVLEEGITLKGHSDNTRSLVTVNSGGNLVLKDGGEISGNTAHGSLVLVNSGGGVLVNSDGTFTMNGGVISDNTAKYGGGVHVWGTFTMNGGVISGNTATADYNDGNVYGAVYYGGGVCVGINGMFTMNGGVVSGNTATNYSSGVYVESNGTFTQSGGEISGNFGNGVYVKETFTQSGGEISDNSGTGVYVYSGMFTMSGGTISGNTAYEGGGVYVNVYGTFTKQSGGIIYGSDADAGLKNTSTYGNGHAVYVRSGSSAKIRNTTAGVGVTLDSRTSGSAGGWE